MIQDILQYFPLNSIGECGGLFTTPLSNRPWSSRPNKSIHGVSYTQFADAFDIKLNPQHSNSATLFDMFHGKCADYLDYFCKENPDWEPYVLIRDGWNSLIHAFAVKKTEDGRFLFADARGFTDNVLDFFTDFRFSKANMSVEPTYIRDCSNPEIPFFYHYIWDEIEKSNIEHDYEK